MDIFNNAKKLGFGLMRLPLTDPNEAGSIDVEQTKQMWTPFWSAASPTLIPPGCTVPSKVKTP